MKKLKARVLKTQVVVLVNRNDSLKTDIRNSK